MLTLGSLFDGIGGWQLAAVHAGVKPIWSSEIEKFPLAVTAKHFPDTVQLGDITKLDGAMLSPVDIVCAGSPCQGLSLSGKRKGLNDERSGLFIKSVELVRRMRDITNGKYPRFFVWETVFGAFSCNKGRDFQAVLSEIGQTDVPMPRNGRWAPAGLAGLPECDIAWRTLDAQFWGVPQRRRRIFLVADFAEKNRCAAEVLFVEQSVPRDTAESSTARKEVAAVAGDGAEVSSWCISENEKTYSVQAIGHIVESEKSSTLAARDYKSSRNFVEYQKQETDDVRTVRRLTVTECERLQGLPDGYTDVPLNGKPASESERLKAIGNGMAQPCADYVIKRIVGAQRQRTAGER